jgi:hypothetical protein
MKPSSNWFAARGEPGSLVRREMVGLSIMTMRPKPSFALREEEVQEGSFKVGSSDRRTCGRQSWRIQYLCIARTPIPMKIAVISGAGMTASILHILATEQSCFQLPGRTKRRRPDQPGAALLRRRPRRNALSQRNPTSRKGKRYRKGSSYWLFCGHGFETDSRALESRSVLKPNGPASLLKATCPPLSIR